MAKFNSTSNNHNGSSHSKQAKYGHTNTLTSQQESTQTHRSQNRQLHTPGVHAASKSQYDRNNSAYTQKKKMKPWKKFLLLFVSALLLLIGAGILWIVFYYHNIQNSLGYEGDVTALNSALTEADYEAPFYTLVIGSDKWENYEAHSDAMILARVDLNKALVTMVSIPRDTPYQLNGQTVKLNQVFTEQGEIACIKAVSQLTGVPIAHYTKLEFDQLQQVVDSLGGIKVEVPYSINYTVYTNDQDTVHIDSGEQLLSGTQAIALARMRTAYPSDGKSITEDAIRQANIRAMMVAVIKQTLSSSPNEIPSKIQQLSGMTQTDIPLNSLIDWAIKLSRANKITLYSCTGPTAGDIDKATGLWLTTEAPESWRALMRSVDAGEDPQNILSTNTEDGSIKLETKNIIEN